MRFFQGFKRSSGNPIEVPSKILSRVLPRISSGTTTRIPPGTPSKNRSGIPSGTPLGTPCEISPGVSSKIHSGISCEISPIPFGLSSDVFFWISQKKCL